MINTHLLDLPLFRIYFMVPKVFEPLKFYCMWLDYGMKTIIPKFVCFIAVTQLCGLSHMSPEIWIGLDFLNTLLQTSGPGCSKLTTSLINVSLKFQTLIS